MRSSSVRLPRRGIFPFSALLALGAAGAAAGPISFDGTTTYTQDFQTMTGTAILSSAAGTLTQSLNVNTMKEVSELITGSSGVQGWYILPQCGTGSNAWTTSLTKWYGSDPGSSSSGGFRQLYDTSGGRALGSEGSGSTFGFFGLVLQNTSSSTINTLSLSYDAVMNRNPSSTVNQYPLSYLVSSTAVSTLNTVGAPGTFSDTAMTATSMGFSTPAALSGTGAPGTQASISPMFKIATISGNLSSLSWGVGQYLYLAWKEADETGSDANAGVDNFRLSVPVGVKNLTWGLIVNGAWDSATANFTSSGSSTAFAANDNVTFDNAAGGVITLSGALAPTSITVSATSGTFTFSGPTATDKITGGTSIAKSGAGTLILTSANDFSGGVTITGGTLQFDGAGRLGTGPISLNGSGASLVSTSSSAVSMSANALSIGASGGTINTGANGLTLGALTISGMLTKTGAGSLTVGTVTPNAGTGFTVSAGDLVLGQTSGVVKVFANTTLTGNLVLNSGIRFDVNGGSTVSGSGKIKVAATGALFSNTSLDVGGGTISTEIALNSNPIAFTPGTWAGSVYTPSASFLTTFGGISGSTLSIFFLSGDSDVDLSTNSTTGGGAGTLTLTGASTYTGNTTINANTPGITGASSVVLGVNNALPVGTGLIVGTKGTAQTTGLGVPVLDLNGKNQQFAYVADGANVTAAKYLKIVNNAASASVLTLGGSVSPGAAFSGYISDGAGTIALVKTGSNTQTLSGFGAYSGGVTVNAGTLKVIPPSLASISTALGSGAVFVGGSGQLFVAATIANAVTVNSGGRVSGNGQLDLITVNSGGVIAANSSLTQLNVATLTANNTATLVGGSVIEWKLNDASAAAGIGYDTFNFTTGLDLSGASAANKIVVRIISFNSPSAAGNPLSMNQRLINTFSFASASSVTKPSLGTNIADLFTYDVSQFHYSDGTSSNAGLWAMSFDQNTATMTLTAVPEPSTYGLGLGALLLAAAAVRRRRRKA
jgi:fibronectin-binding autotransporter adhesin